MIKGNSLYLVCAGAWADLTNCKDFEEITGCSKVKDIKEMVISLSIVTARYSS